MYSCAFLDFPGFLGLLEIGYARWPGETVALREVMGLAASGLRKLDTPRDPPVVYLRWGQ